MTWLDSSQALENISPLTDQQFCDSKLNEQILQWPLLTFGEASWVMSPEAYQIVENILCTQSLGVRWILMKRQVMTFRTGQYFFPIGVTIKQPSIQNIKGSNIVVTFYRLAKYVHRLFSKLLLVYHKKKKFLWMPWRTWHIIITYTVLHTQYLVIGFKSGRSGWVVKYGMLDENKLLHSVFSTVIYKQEGIGV